MGLKIFSPKNYYGEQSTRVMSPHTLVSGMANEVMAEVREHPTMSRLHLVFGARPEVTEQAANVFHALQLRNAEFGSRFLVQPFSLIYALSQYCIFDYLPKELSSVRDEYEQEETMIIDGLSGEVFNIPAWIADDRVIQWVADQTIQLETPSEEITAVNIPGLDEPTQREMILMAHELRRAASMGGFDPYRVHFKLVPTTSVNRVYDTVDTTGIRIYKAMIEGILVDGGVAKMTIGSAYSEVSDTLNTLTDEILEGLNVYGELVNQLQITGSRTLVNLPYWMIPALNWDGDQSLPANPDDTPLSILAKRILAAKVAGTNLENLEELVKYHIAWNIIYGVLTICSYNKELTSVRKGQRTNADPFTVPFLFKSLTLSMMAQWLLDSIFSSIEDNMSGKDIVDLLNRDWLSIAKFSGNFRKFLTEIADAETGETYRDRLTNIISQWGNPVEAGSQVFES